MTAAGWEGNPQAGASENKMERSQTVTVLGTQFWGTGVPNRRGPGTMETGAGHCHTTQSREGASFLFTPTAAYKTRASIWKLHCKIQVLP